LPAPLACIDTVSSLRVTLAHSVLLRLQANRKGQWW
jgi:hypothetical protein